MTHSRQGCEGGVPGIRLVFHKRKIDQSRTPKTLIFSLPVPVLVLCANRAGFMRQDVSLEPRNSHTQNSGNKCLQLMPHCVTACTYSGMKQSVCFNSKLPAEHHRGGPFSAMPLSIPYWLCWVGRIDGLGTGERGERRFGWTNGSVTDNFTHRSHWADESGKTRSSLN